MKRMSPSRVTLTFYSCLSHVYEDLRTQATLPRSKLSLSYVRCFLDAWLSLPLTKGDVEKRGTTGGNRAKLKTDTPTADKIQVNVCE